jgi:spermidine/putrescine transport system substrate-binding protein
MNAHKLINFILDAEAGAAIADYIQYATPNWAAKALLPDTYTKNPAIFPPDSVIAISEASIYQGEDHRRVIDETWTRIQAA